MDPIAFRFHSDLFQIDPREDEETNPFCYGKSLAEWLHGRFEELRYELEPVIAEDWGWCVMLQRRPFMLWVACGNDRSEFYRQVTPEQKASFVPDGRNLLWHCFAGADTFIWTKFFWRQLVGRASTQPQVSLVTDQIRHILKSEPRIRPSPDG